MVEKLEVVENSELPGTELIQCTEKIEEMEVSKLPIGPKSRIRIGPKSRMGPKNRMGPKSRIGPKNQMGPKSRIGAKVKLYTDTGESMEILVSEKVKVIKENAEIVQNCSEDLQPDFQDLKDDLKVTKNHPQDLLEYPPVTQDDPKDLQDDPKAGNETENQDSFGLQEVNERFKIANEIETSPKEKSCQYCNETFTKRSALKIHERNHLKEFFLIKMGVHSCNACGKDFAGATTLRIHQRVHNEDLKKKTEKFETAKIFDGAKILKKRGFKVDNSIARLEFQLEQTKVSIESLSKQKNNRLHLLKIDILELSENVLRKRLIIDDKEQQRVQSFYNEIELYKNKTVFVLLY